jgi:hypothetical protein
MIFIDDNSVAQSGVAPHIPLRRKKEGGPMPAASAICLLPFRLARIDCQQQIIKTS